MTALNRKKTERAIWSEDLNSSSENREASIGISVVEYRSMNQTQTRSLHKTKSEWIKGVKCKMYFGLLNNFISRNWAVLQN